MILKKVRKFILRKIARYIARLADKMDFSNECLLYKAADNLFDVVDSL